MKQPTQKDKNYLKSTDACFNTIVYKIGMAALCRYFITAISFPEITWNTKLLTFKYPVEIGNVIKTAIIGDLGNRISGFYEHS